MVIAANLWTFYSFQISMVEVGWGWEGARRRAQNTCVGARALGQTLAREREKEREVLSCTGLKQFWNLQCWVKSDYSYHHIIIKNQIDQIKYIEEEQVLRN